MSKNPARERIQSMLITLLCKRRKELGISMTEVAEKSGLSLSMISFVEREIRKPTMDTLLRIAEALNVDLWKLLRDATKAAGKKVPLHTGNSRSDCPERPHIHGM